jgi:hypothetical protein
MILLSLLAVGVLSLSTATLRSNNAEEGQAEAKANARLALSLAIGQLQKELGPDRRISARASLIHSDPSEPNLVGAWESARWDAEEGNLPDYSEKSDLFGSWLVSANNPEQVENLNLPTTGLSNPITLISANASGNPQTQEIALRAELVDLEQSSSDSGGYAYAVMDENMKAPINLPDSKPEGTAEEIAFRTAPPRPQPEILVSALNPDTLGNPDRIPTLSTAVLAAGSSNAEDILGRQNSITTDSLSLLTNVVEGGFKKDLTTALESNEDLAEIFGEPTLYFTEDDGAPTWEYLRDHYKKYQIIQRATEGQPTIEYGPRDLRPTAEGTEPAPETERLLPVIAKLQVVFSLVTHYSHIGNRVSFFNENGNPRGNTRYGVPHLVYDPVVTLYNPYDVALEMEKLRIQISDPPVLFGFKKNDNWLRQEHASGEFHSLTRFQIAYEKAENPPPKKFVLLLSELGSNQSPGEPLTFSPGEVKVFSPWVEEDWNWALETSGGYTPRAFFDWEFGSNLGTIDNRTGNQFGLETVPGWDARAGLQTDHLSYAGRPQSTRYPFEIQNNHNGGWLGIKLTDTVSVTAKPGPTNTSEPGRGRRGPESDFTVDLLAGLRPEPDRDLLRSYSFNFANIEEELAGGVSDPEIERTFLAGDLLQRPQDFSPGGKTPFGILTMTAKTTVDPKDVSKPWLHNHPVTEGVAQNSENVGNALDTYDLRFEEIQDFNSFPGVELDPESNRGFYGASATANRGVSNVPMFRVPLTPASSLGDLIPANLVASSLLPRVTHPLGNSQAHPLIPADAVSRSSPAEAGGRMLDHSFLINEALWDSTFFSTIASFQGGLAPNTNRRDLLESFFQGKETLLNPRLVPIFSATDSAEERASRLDGLNTNELTNEIAASLAIDGGFNINSDSVGAWQALLASLRDQAVRGWLLNEYDSGGKASYPRASLPLGGDAENAANNSIDVQGQVRWAGFRALNDNQIKTLAEAIVEQLRQRGEIDKAPNLSLAEFVNRRLGSPGDLHTLKGLLEAAIEESEINASFHELDSKSITGSEQISSSALNGIANSDARLGMTGEGAPSILTQGDLLMPLASVITARGDTFRIRAYGESRSADGSTDGQAWCEAVVQRLPQYLDPSDDSELAEDELQSETNVQFGRRFAVTSFRWLSPDEI